MLIGYSKRGVYHKILPNAQNRDGDIIVIIFQCQIGFDIIQFGLSLDSGNQQNISNGKGWNIDIRNVVSIQIIE